MSVTSDSAARVRSIGAGIVRWSLFLLVLWYVFTQARGLWAANRDIDVRFDWKYLVAAGVISQLSWLPSTWFWQKLIELLGESKPHRYSLIRAYFCGSLGKYIPGKAAVILIRSALLQKQGVSFVRASIASMVEAGAVMVVGCVVTVAFALTVIPVEALPVWARESVSRDATSWSSLLVAVALLILAMPVVAVPSNWIFGKITRIVQKRARTQTSLRVDQQELSGEGNQNQQAEGLLTWKFLSIASLMFAMAWGGHGFSLLLVLRSMDSGMISIDNWTIATSAAAAGTSIGFFAVFAPGGLAVREGLIITMLAPSTGGPIAVAAAGIYRLVSLAAECLAALVLYLVSPRTVDAGASSKPLSGTD